jgi:hypothetical protein
MNIKQKLKMPLQMICSLLIMAAPIILTQSNCYYMWGEPECPDCLKQME